MFKVQVVWFFFKTSETFWLREVIRGVFRGGGGKGDPDPPPPPFFKWGGGAAHFTPSLSDLWAGGRKGMGIIYYLWFLDDMTYRPISQKHETQIMRCNTAGFIKTVPWILSIYPQYAGSCRNNFQKRQYQTLKTHLRHEKRCFIFLCLKK